jgi:Lactonase, 7-bladed beta-propeller
LQPEFFIREYLLTYAGAYDLLGDTFTASFSSSSYSDTSISTNTGITGASSPTNFRSMPLNVALQRSSREMAAKPTNSFDVLVGTYTSGKSKGIYSFRFNADSGDLQPLASPTETVNPSYLVVSPDERFVYAVNELHGCGNEPGAVSAFHFDAASGALTFINKVSSVGESAASEPVRELPLSCRLSKPVDAIR